MVLSHPKYSQSIENLSSLCEDIGLVKRAEELQAEAEKIVELINVDDAPPAAPIDEQMISTDTESEVVDKTIDLMSQNGNESGCCIM